VSFSVSLRVTTGPENMRGVEVGWARKGMAWWDDGGAGAGRVRTLLLPKQKSLSVPASEAPTECFDWAGEAMSPVYAPHIVVSCHISPDQTTPTQSLATNASDIVCLAAGRLRAVATVISLARIYNGLSSPGPNPVLLTYSDASYTARKSLQSLHNNYPFRSLSRLYAVGAG